MKLNRPDYLRPALDVIARTDPGYYQKMRDTAWTLFVVDNGEDVTRNALQLFRGQPEGEEKGYAVAKQLCDSLNHTFGSTIHTNADDSALPDWAYPLENTSWLNRHAITDTAKNTLHTSVTEAVATVIVHEFAHILGANEPKAFATGTAFARKLGNRAIAAWSDATLENITADGKMDKATGKMTV